MRVLVFGASGYIGTHLVPRLTAAGHQVRASSRNADVLRARAWPGVEVVAADAHDEASLDAALEGIEVAYYLVHSMAAGEDFARLDRDAARHFRRAAAHAGVQRIIYLGGLQPGGERSEHLSSRAETGDILRDGVIAVTEIRAGIIVGAGSAAFEVIRDLALHLRVMTTPRWVRSRTQPIALDDLLTYLVRLLETPATAGQTYDVGGPEVLSYEAMMRQFAEVNGRKVTIIPLPILSPRISSYWLDLVTAVPRNVAKPLIDGLKHDLLADDTPIRALIPIPLHTYREAVVAAIEAERTQAVPARWTEGALRYRAGRTDVAFHSKRATASVDSTARPEALWSVVAGVGGKNGWYAFNTLWRLRGILDRALGGTGMRRGRRHPTEVRVGDAIDWWRVAGVEPGRRLSLVAEMKLPGSAVLEFEVSERPQGGSRLKTTAYFHPAGVFGLLYWIPLIPVHGALFGRMTRAMVRRAEEVWRD